MATSVPPERFTQRASARRRAAGRPPHRLVR